MVNDGIKVIGDETWFSKKIEEGKLRILLHKPTFLSNQISHDQMTHLQDLKAYYSSNLELFKFIIEISFYQKNFRFDLFYIEALNLE